MIRFVKDADMIVFILRFDHLEFGNDEFLKETKMKSYLLRYRSKR